MPANKRRRIERRQLSIGPDDLSGADVLAEHIAEHPCTRPWGWWEFEMPEPRRVVDGWEDPRDGFHCDPNKREYYFGKPATTVSRYVQYETQCDYLDRLFLLTDEERSLLAINPELREAGY